MKKLTWCLAVVFTLAFSGWAQKPFFEDGVITVEAAITK